MLCLHNTHRFECGHKQFLDIVTPKAAPILLNLRGWQGLDRSTSAPLPPKTCLQQAGLWQTQRLQDLGLMFFHFLPIITVAQ